MKALLKKSSAAEPFSFSFVNDEGKMVLKSENYKAKDSASKGINSCLLYTSPSPRDS